VSRALSNAIEMPLEIPLRGVSEGGSYATADPRFALAATNVHVLDAREKRVRISTRQGILALWDLDDGDRSESAPLQFMDSARVLRSGGQTECTALVHRGAIHVSLGTAAPEAVSESAELVTSGHVSGFHLFGVMYFVDGTNAQKVDLKETTLEAEAWEASAGTFPADGAALPTLACRFGARAALAGISTAPNNWFLSTINDPDNWTVDLDDFTKALDGQSTPGFGELGEPIRLMAPFGETSLLFGCDQSITLLTGDPALVSDSRMLTLSRSVGTPAGPNAYCHGPDKAIYILATDGVYRLTPNNFRVERSTSLTAGRWDRFFSSIPWGNYTGCLVWDHERDGLWVFVTPGSGSTSRSGRHLFWHRGSDSWWPMRFLEPFWDGAVCACHRRTGAGTPELLLGGGWGRVCTFGPPGGIVRAYDGHPATGATTTTRTPLGDAALIRSHFRFMPRQSPTHTEALVSGVRAWMGETPYIVRDKPMASRSIIRPRLSLVSGETAEHAAGGNTRSDPIRVRRVSKSIVNGGGPFTPPEAYTRTFNGGGPFTTDYSGRGIFGGGALTAIGIYEVNDPLVEPISFVWLNGGDFELAAASDATPADLAYDITHPGENFLDPEYVQVAGSLNDPGDPAIFRCARPGHEDDVVSATIQAQTPGSAVDLGILKPGRNEMRRCRVRSGGFLVRFDAYGAPIVLDSVVVRLEGRGPRRQKLAEAEN